MALPSRAGKLGVWPQLHPHFGTRTDGGARHPHRAALHPTLCQRVRQGSATDRHRVILPGWARHTAEGDVHQEMIVDSLPGSGSGALLGFLLLLPMRGLGIEQYYFDVWRPPRPWNSPA